MIVVPENKSGHISPEEYAGEMTLCDQRVTEKLFWVK